MLRRIVRTKLRCQPNNNNSHGAKQNPEIKSEYQPRVVRRTESPYHEVVSDVYQKYGRYSHLFEDPTDSLKKYDDKFDKHQKFIWYGYVPGTMNPAYPYDGSFMAPNVTIAGNVMLHQYTSIWYGSVIRADNKQIKIGLYTNVQDNTVIQDYYKPVSADNDGSTIIGAYVTIGHSCKIRAATVEPFCVVGSNSVLMEDSYMESGSHLGAGSVLYPGQRVPHGELWIGNPAKFSRKLTEDEIGSAKSSADYYWRLSTRHAEEFYISEMLHYELEKLGHEVGVKASYEEKPLIPFAKVDHTPK